MAKSNIKKVTVRGDAITKALQPLQDSVARLEQASTSKEVNRLMAEHGPKKVASG